MNVQVRIREYATRGNLWIYYKWGSVDILQVGIAAVAVYDYF